MGYKGQPNADAKGGATFSVGFHNYKPSCCDLCARFPVLSLDL